MISPEEIKRLSTRYQTTALTVAREYIQHCFLSELYRLRGSEKIFFKGGTCLRIIYQSPRFSEDLDFTAVNHLDYKKIEDLIQDTLTNLGFWGFETDIREAKKTSGGYLSKLIFSFLDYSLTLKIEISFRQTARKIEGEFTRIKNGYIEDFDIYHLSPQDISNGKITALLSRAKARDWYDIYFLLRNNLFTIGQKKKLKDIGEKLEKSQINFRKELKEFLPHSHQLILKDFKKHLLAEIERHLAR